MLLNYTTAFDFSFRHIFLCKSSVAGKSDLFVCFCYYFIIILKLISPLQTFAILEEFKNAVNRGILKRIIKMSSE